MMEIETRQNQKANDVGGRRRFGRRRCRTLVWLLVLGILTMGAVAGAESEASPGKKMPASGEAAEMNEDPAKPGAPAKEPASDDADARSIVAYVPPRGRGSARVTAGAGTRTSGRRNVEIAVLAPDDHVALTTHSQPTLYWFVSKSTATRIDVTVVDEESIDPLLEVTLPGPVASGIHALRLEEYGLELVAGKTYRWYVTLVENPERRSGDVIAGGAIARTQLTSELERSLVDAPFAYAPYALSGIWYDAIDELLGAIAEHPENKRLKLQRHALLEQAELRQVASFSLRADR